MASALAPAEASCVGGAPERHTLSWPAERAYSLTDARAILRTLHSTMRTYRRLGDEECQNLLAEITPLNRWLSTPVALPQLLSLRNLLSIHLSTQSHMRLQRRGIRTQLHQYFATYRSMKTAAREVVVRGAALYRLPPLLMCEQYLLNNGYTAVDVRRMMQKIEYAPLETRPALEWAREEDALGPRAVTDQQQNALLYEQALEAWLRTRGLRFRTQADLTREQMSAHGRALSTPDILFDQPVRIYRQHGDPVEVRWLDAKNYFYTPLVDFEQLDHSLSDDLASYRASFVDQKLHKQNERYQEHYGPGAFVFSGGYTRDAAFGRKLPLLLDLALPHLSASPECSASAAAHHPGYKNETTL